MENQQRVTFRFGAALEVHYLAVLPEVGDMVTHRRSLWTVARVERDSLGALVICEYEPSRSANAPATAQGNLYPSGSIL